MSADVAVNGETRLLPSPSIRESSSPKLPDIKRNNNTNRIDRTKPLPTSLQQDFIPEDVLLALTQTNPPRENLGPPTKNKRAPANVWNYPGRREKFKHLTENTVCVCGAGKDISFLYDVPPSERSKEQQPSPNDPSAQRVEKKPKQPVTLPDTLIPEEYHIVKNKGVLGLEYYEDNFTTQPDDHEKHLVVFPSMNPVSRYEVQQLKKTLNEMLRKAGLDENMLLVETETQMHQLLELIKTEQDIYNIVFHEIIRQVSIECVDRGELLAELRKRYSGLLSKIPDQVRSLHEEVLAQRALDRRLTEELLRFKNTIGHLTNELVQVKQHDRIISREAHTAQQELKEALEDSRKNANLLSEYHDLYELQRERLEQQVVTLTEEKEIWSTAAYSLALKVTIERNLTTAKRLHVGEKAWQKLANHFTILLSDQDTEVLTKLQSHTDKWRDLVESFHYDLKKRDDEMKEVLLAVKSDMAIAREQFVQNFLNEEGMLHSIPNQEQVTEIYGFIKQCEEYLYNQMDKFSGELLLNAQDQLKAINREMEGWTDCGLKVFSRHRPEGSNEYHDQNNMNSLNQEIEELISQYHTRLTGENGVAKGLITLTNVLENWDNKLNALLHGSNPLPDADWSRFYNLLEEWQAIVEETRSCIFTTQKDDLRQEGKPHNEIEYGYAVRSVQKWATKAVNGIDSEDAKLVEAVISLHASMVRWMVQMLLRIAPDREDNSDEAKKMSLLGSLSLGELQNVAKTLSLQLTVFSTHVTNCCMAMVKDSMQKRMEQHELNADQELNDLLKLKVECDNWISTASLMLEELIGKPIDLTPKDLELAPSREVTAATPDSAATTARTDAVRTPSVPQTPTTPMTDAPRLSILPITEKINEESELAPVIPPATPELERSASVYTAEETTRENTEITRENTEISQDGGQLNTTDSEVEKHPSDIQEEEQDDDDDDAEDEEEEDGKEEIQFLATDKNTHFTEIKQDPDSQPPKTDYQMSKDGPDTPNTEQAYEALAAVETLQSQLTSAEERAQEAEEQVRSLEDELKTAMEKVRALERQIKDKEEAEKEAQSEAEAGTPEVKEPETPKQTSQPATPAKEDKKTRSTSRSSSRGGGKKK